MKYKFINDYSEGCHPDILEAFAKTNLSQEYGYGSDAYSISASDKIRRVCNKPGAGVYFVAGGTLANLLVISSLLKPYESVISAESGHINTHEAGAVEATGHKIEYVKTGDGKLKPSQIEGLLEKFPKYHTVKPRLVYISNTTEIGTVYKASELKELYNFCQQNDLILFIDGARLPMAFMSPASDLTLPDIASHCDVFYFGGTKCGALFGEAIVITNPQFRTNFEYHIKQRGAMLAKGRSIGVQFDALFENNLIFKLAGHANKMAFKMAENLRNKGFDFLSEPESNQIFPILPIEMINRLLESYEFFEWEKVDSDYSAVRLVCSWATEEAAVDEFLLKIDQIS